MTNEPVSTGRRLTWSFGGFADMLMYNGTSALTNQIYTVALGLPPLLVSTATAVPRLLDLAIDPILGYWSDNTRSRWGRRKPWMVAGAIGGGALVALVWHPPLALGNTAVFIFLAGVLTLLFSGAYGAYTISHNAAGYEMSADYDERTQLFKWRMCAMAAAGLLTPWLPRLCLALEGDRAGIFKGAQGVKTVGLVLGLLVIVTGLIPVFGALNPIGRGAEEKPIALRTAIRMTMVNRPFWLLVVSNVVTKFGTQITGVFFYYLIVYHVSDGSLKSGATWWGLFVNAINLGMFLAMGPVAAVSARLGKRTTLLLGLAASALIYGTVGWSLNPRAPAFCLLAGALMGIFTNTLPMIKSSMLADVCDWDELQSGHRREAFYSAVFLTSDKLAMAISLACQGALLVASGFHAADGVQTTTTIHYWLWAVMLTQPAGFLVGMAAIAAYPLNRERCREIRRQLDLRQLPAVP